MPVYNGQPYLREAIESILNQCFTDFEFLIINDGSTDHSGDIIHEYEDPRIRLVNNEQNIGLIHALNQGIDLAQGEFIARMDCDDISVPERLGKQVAFMEDHPEVGVCGGWMEYFMGKTRVVEVPLQHEEIIRALPRYNPMFHPTVMIRTQTLRSQCLYYNAEYRWVEDYELWIRLARITYCANLPEVLVRYRIHREQVSCKHSDEQRANIKKIQAKLRSK